MKDQKVSTSLGAIILVIIAATVGGFVLLCFKNYPISSDINSLISPAVVVHFETKAIDRSDEAYKLLFSATALEMGLDCEKDADAKRICLDGTWDDLFDELCIMHDSCKKERDVDGWARSEQSKYFIKDNTVYMEGVFNVNEGKIIKVEGADPSSFRVLGHCTHTEVYARDKNYIYVGSERLDDVDVTSFEYLGIFSAGSDMSSKGSMARDRNHIYYYCGNAADYVDVSTFEILGGGYSRDKDFVYYFGALTNIDPGSVAVKSYADNDFKGNFAMDTNSVFYERNRINNVDVHSCQIDSLKECLPNTWRKDVVYFSNEIDLSKTILDDQTDWYTYRNNNYGLTFKYPSDWIVSEESGVVTVRWINEFLFNINLTNWKKIVIEENGPGTAWQGIAKYRWQYFVDHRDDIVSGQCSSEVISLIGGPTAANKPKKCLLEKGKNYIKVKTESSLSYYVKDNEIRVSSNENIFSQLDPVLNTIVIKDF